MRLLAGTKIVALESLKCYHENLMKCIDAKIELATSPNKTTHCPNCAALIKSNVCEYCGTDFTKFFIK